MRHADDPTPIICQGVWQGEILNQRQGERGFGYDPVFYSPEKKCSAAMLDKATKHALSHRGKALSLLLEQLKAI
jgi:XTP/dITP diphosphohydrolase